MTRGAALIVLIVCGLGCAIPRASPRFVRHKIPLSPWCNLTIIYDQRTRVCLAAYACGVMQAESQSLVQVPKEVCDP